MGENKKERAQAMPTTPSVHTDNSNTKKTQWQVVLDELIEQGEEGITSWDMITRHHITRTAAHICTLKKMGYNIFSCNETNNGVTYSRYWLEQDEEEDEDEEDDEYDANALAEEIWEATGRWVSPESLMAEREYEAVGTWRNNRGW